MPENQNGNLSVTQDFSSIPDALKQKPQWVCWRLEDRDGKQTKIPYNPTIGTMASSTDPATWSGYKEAVVAFEKNEYTGIGYVFSKDDPFCGIDIDNCIENGKLKPWAVDILLKLDSYTEISPSGTGVKVFVRAEKPGNKCRKAYQDGEVEMYHAKRYFTVTGAVMSEYSNSIEERQDELSKIYDDTFGASQNKSDEPKDPKEQNRQEKSVPISNNLLTDDEILNIIRHSKQADRFNSLWSGDTTGYDDDDSRADAALCATLAFYTKDPRQIDSIFRQSGLIRAKWDEKRGVETYGQITVNGALETVTGQYERQVSANNDYILPSDESMRIAENYLRLNESIDETYSLRRYRGEWYLEPVQMSAIWIFCNNCGLAARFIGVVVSFFVIIWVLAQKY